MVGYFDWSVFSILMKLEFNEEEKATFIKEFDSSPTICGKTLYELSKEFNNVGICMKWFGCMSK